MSVKGHKRTFRNAIALSALPPKADIPSGQRDVRFVISDILPIIRSSRRRVAEDAWGRRGRAPWRSLG
jgi:hypothetical protein